MHAWLWIPIAIVIGLVTVSVVPLPGRCDIQVSVQNLDVGVIVGNVYSITSVNAKVLGGSKVLDWQAFGLGFAPPTLYATLSEKVTLSDGQSVTRSENVLAPSVPLLNGQQLTAGDTFTIGYVPAGSYGIAVELDQNGAAVATGSGSVNVGC